VFPVEEFVNGIPSPYSASERLGFLNAFIVRVCCVEFLLLCNSSQEI
jgi:hypothetical protein